MISLFDINNTCSRFILSHLEDAECSVLRLTCKDLKDNIDTLTERYDPEVVQVRKCWQQSATVMAEYKTFRQIMKLFGEAKQYVMVPHIEHPHSCMVDSFRSIIPEEVTHPIVRGVDMLGRNFINFRYRSSKNETLNCQILYQHKSSCTWNVTAWHAPLVPTWEDYICEGEVMNEEIFQGFAAAIKNGKNSYKSAVSGSITMTLC